LGAATRGPAREGRLLPPLNAPLVVVDTSVVMAHLTAASEDTPSGRIVRACGTGSLRAALSDKFLTELTRVVRLRDRQGQIASASRAFVAAMDLWSHGTLYHPASIEWPTVVDRKDIGYPTLLGQRQPTSSSR
jgi:predicted nucleic acid-binding protein